MKCRLVLVGMAKIYASDGKKREEREKEANKNDKRRRRKGEESYQRERTRLPSAAIAADSGFGHCPRATMDTEHGQSFMVCVCVRDVVETRRVELWANQEKERKKT